MDGEKLIGFNTDGPGLLRALREEFYADLRDLRVMLLGAGGGAGRAIAVQCALESCDVRCGEGPPMRLAVLKERRPAETRVSATPETVKKYKALGLDVAVEAGAGLSAGVTDDAFRKRAPRSRPTPRRRWRAQASC